MSKTGWRSAVCLYLLASGLTTVAFAQEPAKWFVLREQQTGYCRLAFLPRIASYYPHGFSGIAGGPYEKQDEAVARQRQLELQGICQQG